MMADEPKQGFGDFINKPAGEPTATPSARV
jgi:hypothetical protein